MSNPSRTHGRSRGRGREKKWDGPEVVRKEAERPEDVEEKRGGRSSRGQEDRDRVLFVAQRLCDHETDIALGMLVGNMGFRNDSVHVHLPEQDFIDDDNRIDDDQRH